MIQMYSMGEYICLIDDHTVYLYSNNDDIIDNFKFNISKNNGVFCENLYKLKWIPNKIEISMFF